MNQKTIQYLATGAIVISVLVSGYIILSPKKQEVAQSQDVSGLAPMVDGKQVIKMTVFATDYTPSSFTVKAGVPVRWEITSSGQPGCDSGAVVSSILPNGSVYLNPNKDQVAVAEFTLQNAGSYKFACPMGMVRGTIQVVN